MNEQASRRTFISAVAVGAPLLVGAGAGAITSPAATGSHSHDGRVDDPLLTHIRQQLGAILREARARGALTENDAAVAAAYLRLCRVRATAIEVDRAVKRAVDARVAIHGRAAMIDEQPDVAHVATMLARKGTTGSERVLQELARTSRRARNAVVDRMLRSETTAVFESMATTLDAMRPRLAERDRAAGRIQYDPYVVYCQWLQEEYWQYLYMAYGFCNWAASDPAYEELCASMWSAVAMIEIAFLMYCTEYWYVYY